jgi:hypothetical protein
MAEHGQKRPKGHSVAAHTLMMRAVPYFAAQMPVPQIAKLFKKSERTVARWAMHPDVKRALGTVEEHVIEHTKETTEELVSVALETLRDIMKNAVDEKARVTAASTTLDRFGYPATSRTENENKNLNIGAIVGFATEQERELAAKGVLPGTASEVDDE